MMRAHHIFLVSLILLVAAAALVPLLPARGIAAQAAVAFNRSTGGFGFGIASEPDWCLHALDPVLQVACPTALRPLPGLLPYCPYETMGLAVFPPLGFAQGAP